MMETAAVQQSLEMAERARRLEARAARETARQAAQQAAADKGQPAPSEPGPGEMPGDPSDMQKPGEPTAELTDGGAITGQAEVADPLRGLDASRRAAIYKLPQRVRDPLLEGMRQRGPAAYQDVIDTYFRQLGRDIPQ
jgi:type II secretory pathway pseudopilin PulG